MSIAAALLAAQYIIGVATQPRPKKFTFEDLKEANKGDETRPIPYIRGRWKTTPQRIWLGDFSARAVERDSNWLDYVFVGPWAFLFDVITVGYRYYTGQAFALCWGPINRVHQVYVQDLPCAVAPVVDNAGGSLLLDDPQLFGGDQPPGAGGIYALCDVIAGNYTQGRNTYIQSVEGNIPALHGIAALVVRGRSGFTESGYFSANTLELREWAVELMAWPDVLVDGLNMLPDQSYNRIHAMYEWATNSDYGAEYPASRIHRPSWLDASQTIYDEGLGFSGEINTGGRVGDVFDQLKASVDAEVFEHPTDGLKIKLIRKDYSLASLKVLDESNTNQVEEYTPGDYVDTFNRVVVPFFNGDNNYTPRPAIYEDPANFQLQRRVATQEINYPGVASATVAQLLATRSGRALAQPLPPLTVNGGAASEDLWPGDVFHFQWTDPLVRKVMRVHARTPQVAFEGERSFRLLATEDQYSVGLSVFGTPEGTDATDPGDVWDTAPPSASFDEVLLPPDGLEYILQVGIGGMLESHIHAAIIFGAYEGGQYARVYVTEPGGVQTLSPIKLSPDADNKAEFTWPATEAGTYEFCIQTYSLTGTTNGVKVCASIGASSFSVSPSASTSPSASVSPSVSPSLSLSASASVSPSTSVSPSLSPSVSPSSSLSPSASTSPSSSSSPSIGVGGLLLWLDANQLGLTDGDAVATWTDFSGNGNDATQSTGGNKPIFYENAINDKPALKFDGTDDFMSLTSSITATGDLTVFVVWKRGFTAPARFLFGGLAANDGFGMLINEPAADGQTTVASSDLASTVSSTAAHHQGGWACSSFTKTSAEAYAFRVNFVAGGSGTGLGDLVTPGPITTIGARESAIDRFWAGYIAEIMIFNGVLSAGEITDVEDYLALKYGGVIGQTRLLWLKGDDIVGLSNGDDMTRWVDSSGQGVRVTVPTPGNVKYQTNLQNSLPGVRFNTNTASRFETDLFNNNQSSFTIYVVYNYKSATSAARRAIQGSSGNWLIGPYNNIHRVFGGVGFTTGLTVVQDQFVIQWAVLRTATGSQNYVNGQTYTSVGNGTPGLFLALSASPAANEPLNGDILEVIVDNHDASASEQEAVRDYLATKYNITGQQSPSVSPSASRSPSASVSPSASTSPSSSASPSAGFATPPTEATWNLWLRSDQEIFTDSGATTPAVNDGDKIYHWRNIKNTAHEWSQAAGVKPTLKTNIVNGNPVVRFAAASSERLSGNAVFAFSSANTFFIVTTKSGVTDSYIVSGDGSEGGPAIISRFSSKDFEYFFDSSGERGTFAASTDTNFHILMVRRTDDSGNYELGFDGPIVATAAVNGGNDWSGRKISQLGTFVGGGNFYSGDIVEIVGCSSSLSNSKVNEFLDYFSASYGISVTHL